MINPAFISYPEEAALLGSMIIGYGELELSFAHIAGIALKQKYAVLEACHSIRSEGARLKLIDALAHEVFAKEGLSSEYEATHRAMNFCLKVRNLYTHAQWGELETGLNFTNPEEVFTRPLKPVRWTPVSLELLEKQEAYFDNTRQWLLYLEAVLEARAKRRQSQWPRPQKMHQPILHIRIKKQVRARSRKGKQQRP